MQCMGCIQLSREASGALKVKLILINLKNISVHSHPALGNRRLHKIEWHSIKRLGISAATEGKETEFQTLPDVKHFTSKYSFPSRSHSKEKETVQFK